MSPQQMANGQLGGTQPRQSPQPQSAPNLQYGGMMMYPNSMQVNQGAGMYSQPMFGGQFYGMSHHHQMYAVQMAGYGFGQQPGAYYIPNAAYAYVSANELTQRMNAVSVQEGNSHGGAMASRPEDSLFGDLVSIAKMKQNKPAAGKVGGL
jgi:hypothetical protein